MNFLDLFGNIKGEFIRQKLIQLGISPNDIQGVDFNNMNDLNNLAMKIMPKILNGNSQLKENIKRNARLFGEEKGKEVCEVIDMN